VLSQQKIVDYFLRFKKLILSRQETRSVKIVVAGIFLIYFLVGVFIFRDYGLSWDEPLQRLTGIVSTNYILGKLSPELAIPGVIPLADYINNDYGVVFDVPAYLLELLFNFDQADGNIYYLRHFLTFFIFFLAVIFFYKLVKKNFNDWRLGLLASSMLVLSPRIFAESFYNSKDIVFLAAFIFGIYFLFNFLERQNFCSGFLFAFFSAYAINIRLFGLLLPLVGIGFYCLEIIFQPRGQLRKKLLILISYLFCLVLLIIFMWPFLWSQPWLNFKTALLNMSNFRWTSNVLYFGQEISALKLPWHYIVVWLGITTPVVYLILFFLGNISLGAGVISSIKKRLYTNKLRFELIISCFFFGPLLATVLFHPVLYNAWRHLYFIYAPFVLLAVMGFNYGQMLIKKINWRPAYSFLPAIMAIFFILIVLRMAQAHPHENVYFNELAGNTQNKFDGDYWGLSYRAALEYIVATDQRPVILLNVNTAPGKINSLLLEPADRERIFFTSPLKADYLLTDFLYQTDCSFSDEIKSFYSGHLKIMGIYRGGQTCQLK